MNRVSLLHYLLTLIIWCNESLFLIILNSLFTDSLHFPTVFTHGFIQSFFNVAMNRMKIINQVLLGLLTFFFQITRSETSFYEYWRGFDAFQKIFVSPELFIVWSCATSHLNQKTQLWEFNCIEVHHFENRKWLEIALFG